MALRMGSWGTPEFGITEKIQSIFAPKVPLTEQKGSNLSSIFTKSPSSASSGTVLGQYTGPMASYPTSSPAYVAPKTPTLSSGGATQQTQQPTQQNPYSGAEDAARAEEAAYLQGLNTEYDRAAEELRGQLSSAGAAREQGLSSLKGSLDQYGNLIGQQKAGAEQATAKNIQSAGSTAAQTQAKSRNVLRALGILSSSAAGDILNRPMTEFGTQKADLQQGLIQRTQELDNALAQKTSEHANLVKQLESQYADIVGKIQTDLRFSDRERADAVAAAKSAVLSRLNEIRMAQANWQNEINAAKSGLTASATGLSDYTNPVADTAKIASTGLNTTQQYKPQTQTASVYGTDQRKLTDLVPSNYA